MDAPAQTLSFLASVCLHGGMVLVLWWFGASLGHPLPASQAKAAPPSLAERAVQVQLVAHLPQVTPPEPEVAPAPVEQEPPPPPPEAKIPPLKPKTQPKPRPKAERKAQARPKRSKEAPQETLNLPFAATANAVQGQRSKLARQRYEQTLAAHIERFKRYPRQARNLGMQGVGVAIFKVALNGQISDIRIHRSTQHALLDEEIRQTLHRASPAPTPPTASSYRVPIRFVLR